jgi:hypothetical protein
MIHYQLMVMRTVPAFIEFENGRVGQPALKQMRVIKLQTPNDQVILLKQYQIQSLRYRLIEYNPITERVRYANLSTAPWHALQTWTRVFVLFIRNFLMQLIDSFDFNPDSPSREAVAIMLANVKNDLSARYLHIQWKIRLKSVLPIDLKSEKIDIKLLRFVLVQHS